MPYNGEAPWAAARELEELIEPVPQSLAAWRPRLRYFVLDEGRVPQATLQQAGNAIARLVQLERSASPQEIANIIGQLAHQLRAPQNRELRRALTVWVRRLVLCQRMWQATRMAATFWSIRWTLWSRWWGGLRGSDIVSDPERLRHHL